LNLFCAAIIIILPTLLRQTLVLVLVFILTLALVAATPSLLDAANRSHGDIVVGSNAQCWTDASQALEVKIPVETPGSRNPVAECVSEDEDGDVSDISLSKTLEIDVEREAHRS
jgi:hypothetical protein